MINDNYHILCFCFKSKQVKEKPLFKFFLLNLSSPFRLKISFSKRIVANLWLPECLHMVSASFICCILATCNKCHNFPRHKKKKTQQSETETWLFFCHIFQQNTWESALDVHINVCVSTDCCEDCITHLIRPQTNFNTFRITKVLLPVLFFLQALVRFFIASTYPLQQTSVLLRHRNNACPFSIENTL